MASHELLDGHDTLARLLHFEQADGAIAAGNVSISQHHARLHPPVHAACVDVCLAGDAFENEGLIGFVVGGGVSRIGIGADCASPSDLNARPGRQPVNTAAHLFSRLCKVDPAIRLLEVQQPGKRGMTTCTAWYARR